ncbi:MAG: class I SAM-dependent methyltransferase [Candidatus Omnitrophica bacterium]|nr:class I SAM-dependent methyltransferase [Candidatus Omnitrophota bacterium]
MQVLSFRDPVGFVVRLDKQIFRIIGKDSCNDLESFLSSDIGKKLLNKEKVIATRFLKQPEKKEIGYRISLKEEEFEIVEHKAIYFPSYPYEWAPEMIYTAACLTVDIAVDILPAGYTLKDATPYNIMFEGPNPILIDMLSFEKRDPRDSVWLPYGQFIRTFTLPLLVNKYFSLRMPDIFFSRRDGIEPEDVSHFCGSLRQFLPPFLSIVAIPNLLSKIQKKKDYGIYKKRLEEADEIATFILLALFKNIRKQINNLKPVNLRQSIWADYAKNNMSYSEDGMKVKDRIVSNFLNEFRPRQVLDVGCNTGYFSEIAAKAGSKVVAIDSDPVVISSLWRKAYEYKLDILPLNIDLTRPSPSIGWLNKECESFLERARGKFDAVFMLAVKHHMMVTERIPMNEILDLAAELTTRHLVIEYIDPKDQMFKILVRGREKLFAYLTRQSFEKAVLEKFNILRFERIEGSERYIYILSLKGIRHD